MLQQLVSETGASGWAIASMLFFIGVWMVIAIKVYRARPETMAQQARLPLANESGGEPPAEGRPRA